MVKTFFACALALLPVCGAAETIEIPFPGFNPTDLGRRFDMESGQLGEACYHGEPVPYTKSHLSHDLFYSRSAEELHANVHGRMGASLSIGLLGASQSVEVVKDLKATQNSLSLVFNIHYRRGSVFLEPLTDVATCQGPHVVGYGYGSVLVVGLNIAFTSREDLTRFKRKVSTSALFGLMKGGRTEVEEVRKSMQDAVITVRTGLEGATDSELEKLGNRMQCTGKDLERCTTLIEKSLTGIDQRFQNAVERFYGQGQIFVQTIFVAGS